MAFNPKEYETVESRLAKFWADHPNGRVHADPLSISETQYVVKAEIYFDRDDPRPVATGLAEETVGSSNVNRTSALENCETSAIGRALANAGYATKGKRASREEMEKVERVQERLATEEKPKADKFKVAGLVDAFAAATSKGDLDGLAVKVAELNLNPADRDVLRASYAAAKERIEAT